jgi:hypothetical protein
VVLSPACPSQCEMVAKSTPALRNATAVECRIECGCRRLPRKLGVVRRMGVLVAARGGQTAHLEKIPIVGEEQRLEPRRSWQPELTLREKEPAVNPARCRVEVTPDAATSACEEHGL